MIEVRCQIHLEDQPFVFYTIGLVSAVAVELGTLCVAAGGLFGLKIQEGKAEGTLWIHCPADVCEDLLSRFECLKGGDVFVHQDKIIDEMVRELRRVWRGPQGLS